MGRSYSKKSASAGGAIPEQWSAVRAHKYCGKLDAANTGKKQKPNKAQHCQDCMVVKAAQAKGVQRDTQDRRQEKFDIGWGGGEEE